MESSLHNSFDYNEMKAIFVIGIADIIFAMDFKLQFWCALYDKELFYFKRIRCKSKMA